jgi:hypothetical protein
MPTKKEMIRAKQKRQEMIKRVVAIVFTIAIIGVLGFAFLSSTQPVLGQSVPVMADTSHVETGQDPGPYNSDPPTSGRHYPQDLSPGFYEESALNTYSPYPEGYLVHNLEHGYVIFWYNCQLMDAQSCQQLKQQIQTVMEAVDNFKVIAFPSESIQFPVVMTSWGQIHEFDTFDTKEAEQFVKRNRNNAPEPNAD